MFFFLKKETLRMMLLKFGYDMTGLTLFEETVVFILGNIFYVITLILFLSILFKFLVRLKRMLF